MPRRARGIRFTDNELRTLLWAINGQFNDVFQRNVKAGKPGKDEQTERLMALYRMIYGELIERHH